jgi:hypothetical protein
MVGGTGIEPVTFPVMKPGRAPSINVPSSVDGRRNRD